MTAALAQSAEEVVISVIPEPDPMIVDQEISAGPEKAVDLAPQEAAEVDG